MNSLQRAFRQFMNDMLGRSPRGWAAIRQGSANLVNSKAIPLFGNVKSSLEPCVWAMNDGAVVAAIGDIVAGRPNTIVLINSLPRTASKFMHGVLTAAWGAETDLDYFALPFDPVRHAHGLSSNRLSELLGGGRGQQAGLEAEERNRGKRDRLEVTSRILHGADRRIVLTIVRDTFDRMLSSFVLRSSNAVAHLPDEKLRARFFDLFDDFVANEELWIRHDVEEYFQTPPVPRKMPQDFLVYQKGSLTYIILTISYVDGFLSRFLFSRVTREDIERRAILLKLRYGPASRNTTADRNLAEFKGRLLGLVSRAECNQRMGSRKFDSRG